MLDTKAMDAAMNAHSRTECELIGVARAVVSERHTAMLPALIDTLARAVEAEQVAYAAMQAEREKLIADFDRSVNGART